MTTQLRLVEPPKPTKKQPAGRARGQANARAHARTATVTRSGRRAVNWGEWQLDARTRTVGRAGVAEARRALEAAAQELSQAS